MSRPDTTPTHLAPRGGAGELEAVAIRAEPRVRVRALRGLGLGELLAAVFAVLLVVAAFAPPLLAPGDPLAIAPREAFTPPSPGHWLGTDESGRDVYTRLVHGAASSLLIGVAATAIGLALGVALGLIAGLAGRVADAVVGRVLEVLFAFPSLLLALLVIVVAGPGPLPATIAVGLSTAPGYARIVRGQVMRIRGTGYVETARLLGHSRARIIGRSILPNLAPELLTLATLGVGQAVVWASTLSFLGLGAQPPAPEWGAMLNAGRTYIQTAWWLTVMPGLAIVGTIITATVLGRLLASRPARRAARAGRGEQPGEPIAAADAHPQTGTGVHTPREASTGESGRATGAPAAPRAAVAPSAIGTHSDASTPSTNSTRGASAASADSASSAASVSSASTAGSAPGTGSASAVVARGTEAAALLAVEGLEVSFGERRVVHDVSFTVGAGECVAIVGESGSGKSVTARALLGLAGSDARVRAERLELEGRDLRGLGARAWRAIRGERIGLVLQDALVSLDPLRPVGREIADAARLHRRASPGARAALALDALRRVGMPDPEVRARQRSGELSGGLRQRALIASAIVLDPPVLIADEPTTALDTLVQRRVLDELSRLKAAGTGVVLISHDLAVVAEIADRVLVMRDGRIVEQGDVRELLTSPKTAYTRELVAATELAPRWATGSIAGLDQPAPTDMTIDEATPTATGRGTLNRGSVGATTANRAATRLPGDAAAIVTATGIGRSFGERVALEDVGFDLRAGETVGVVGESGSGKTTLARIVLGLETPDAGHVELRGRPWSSLPERRRRPERRRIGLVAQDTASSFDPRWPVGTAVADALPTGLPRDLRRARVGELLDAVGLDPTVALRAPTSLSGGQRQRVAIARALAADPEVLVLDEPVSALDVTVQARVLALLDRLQREHGLAYLFVSHDLDVIRHVADRVIVLREGRMVEDSDARALFTAPADAYTAQLLDARPTVAVALHG
jgi:ABC-type glutathione transport system ATPase component/ABC-type dipeptide/oligopeptide/nickel transport system permease subunit